MSLAVQGICKTFVPHRRRADAIRALHEVDLEARAGELVVVVGPSGSGKTTLLRCIAGLERADEGSIRVAERDVTALPPGDRDIAMVFQEYALYPHLSVEKNISFGLRARRIPHSDISRRVDDAAAMLALNGTLERLPAELSGGERQRVALARAIVSTPSVFLLDEPLANLDAGLRTSMRAEIRALQRRLKKTMIYVTHDQTDAMTMGDRIVVLRAGRVEQVAPPTELYERPRTAFVAGFIGTPPMNLLPGQIFGRRDRVGVRAEQITLVPASEGRIVGKVVAVDRLGGDCIFHIEVSARTLLVRTGATRAPALGDEVGLAFADADLYRFGDDGRAL